MQNNFIPEIEWKHSELTDKECLYGYSHSSKGYYPYHIINEIIDVGKTGRVGIKGLSENGEKLYIQLFPDQYKIVKEKDWLKCV